MYQNAAVKRTCFSCKGKPHTTICDKRAKAQLNTNSYTVTHVIVIVSVQEVKCHALIETGAGASYVSSKDITTIQTLMNSSSKKVPIYSVQISKTKRQFNLEIE